MAQRLLARPFAKMTAAAGAAAAANSSTGQDQQHTECSIAVVENSSSCNRLDMSRGIGGENGWCQVVEKKADDYGAGGGGDGGGGGMIGNGKEEDDMLPQAKEVFRPVSRSALEDAQSVCSENGWGNESMAGGGGGGESILEEQQYGGEMVSSRSRSSSNTTTTPTITTSNNTSKNNVKSAKDMEINSNGSTNTGRLGILEAVGLASECVREGLLKSHGRQNPQINGQQQAEQQQQQQQQMQPRQLHLQLDRSSRTIRGSSYAGGDKSRGAFAGEDSRDICVSLSPWASETFYKLGSMMERSGLSREAVAAEIDDAREIAMSDTVLKQIELKVRNKVRNNDRDDMSSSSSSSSSSRFSYMGSRISILSSENQLQEERDELAQKNLQLKNELDRLKAQLARSHTRGSGECNSVAEGIEGEGDQQEEEEEEVDRQRLRTEKEEEVEIMGSQAEYDAFTARMGAGKEAFRSSEHKGLRCWEKLTLLTVIVCVALAILRAAL